MANQSFRVKNGLIVSGDTNTADLYIGGTLTGTTLVAGHFKPDTTATYDLGDSDLRWNNIWTSDLNLTNDHGSWTIVEGEDDLFLYNNKKNKVYKFNLTEVDPEEAPPKR